MTGAPGGSPNAAQAEAWGGDMGRRWAARTADLEAQMAGVLDVLLDRAALAPGERVLDIGCGAGGSTRAAARAVGPSGSALGLDISAPLLALARERAPDNARFVQADAQVHGFDGPPFDAALSRFGVMFFDDPVAAFANIRSALAPGGRLVMACWAGPEGNPWFTDPRDAAVARLGPVPQGDPDAAGPMAFRDPSRVLPILAAAGFADAGVETVTPDLHLPDGWAAMERMLPEIGPIPGILRERGGTQEDLRAILGTLHARWRDRIGPDGIRLPARVRIYAARA
ncbi:class I SAM-dependent methyltransferase [Roseivivax isoporae]|uniref:Methyltransferase n=1 Tax=Roseivivax isoporae LMG 25204 TaxID=1449351 RepID=X7FAS7_9RHOB|nr:methyltransferase domain-containing protein [Roseivivax isoporae]ETX29184.1 methyltransferase [Roseivivax isoporae LMG 25204]